MDERASPTIRGPDEMPRAPAGEPGPGRLWARFLIRLALAALLLGAVLVFVMGVSIQRGNRMYPFLMDGDLVITYKPGVCRVGDVVAYRRPDTGETALSRIAAIGECAVTVTEDGILLVDGVSPAERVFYPTYPPENAKITYPYPVGAGGYFLLDDYREEGQDSRLFGQVSEADLLGKVVYVFRRRGI